MPRISEIDINTVEYWDGIYRRNKFPTADPNNTIRYETAAALHIGTSALDIGCGQGGLALALHAVSQWLDEEIDYVGVDHSWAAIETTLYPDGFYLCMDWQDIQQPADTVYVLELLEHVDDPALLLAHAAKLALSRLIVGVPRYGLITPKLHRGEHQWDFTAEELAALLKPHGTMHEPISTGVECCIAVVDV